MTATLRSLLEVIIIQAYKDYLHLLKMLKTKIDDTSERNRLSLLFYFSLIKQLFINKFIFNKNNNVTKPTKLFSCSDRFCNSQ